MRHRGRQAERQTLNQGDKEVGRQTRRYGGMEADKQAWR